MNRVLFGLAMFVALLAAAVPAQAAVDAHTTADVNMRAGPSTRYAVVTVIPRGSWVTVHGCVNSRTWCDVGWRHHRGWVSARYLSQNVFNQPLYSNHLIMPPIIRFEFRTYHDRWYRGRSFWRRYNGRRWRHRRNP